MNRTISGPQTKGWEHLRYFYTVEAGGKAATAVVRLVYGRRSVSDLIVCEAKARDDCFSWCCYLGAPGDCDSYSERSVQVATLKDALECGEENLWLALEAML